MGKQEDYSALRNSSCACIKTRHIELKCPCYGKVDRYGRRSLCASYFCMFQFLFLEMAASMLGWIKVCFCGIPNEGTSIPFLMCGDVYPQQRCMQCLIGTCNLICVPFLLPLLFANALLIAMFSDGLFFLGWCVSCACCGRMWPIEGVYTNQLNKFHKNDEPPVAVLQTRSVHDRAGAVTYGDVIHETYYGRERECTCDCCIFCPCYQDLKGVVDEDDATLPTFVQHNSYEYSNKSRLVDLRE